MLKKAIVVIKLSFILLFSSAFVLVPQVNRRTATQTLDSALEDKDETFMRLALRHAQHAFREKEVPIGAVVVEDDTGLVLATSRNRVEATQDPTAHAEVNSIRAACGLRNNWRLSGCTLYTTLEPCPMCLSTAMAARVNRVVFGAHDPRLGAAGGGRVSGPASTGTSVPHHLSQRGCATGGVTATHDTLLSSSATTQP